jgi:energy-coupling factor transporter ATP-binding protein EcfA2
MLDLVGLAHAARRAPHQLSGGQQQRVALARALAPRPRLLLLDEPFSSLDVDLRERLAQEVRAILKDSGTTALLVTHDQLEAFAVGDVIGVMNQGVLEQWDDAYTLYHRPASRFVAQFIGHGVFTPAQIVACAHGPCVHTPVGELDDIAGCPLPDALPRRPVRRAAARRRHRARRRQPGARLHRAQGLPRQRIPAHPAPGKAANRCWPTCPRTTTTRSANGSASAPRWTTW